MLSRFNFSANRPIDRQKVSTPPPAAPAPGCVPLERNAIIQRISNCALLPSLSSINGVLRELLNAEQRFTAQISEVIRRDPSMATRMLRLVNSVYYGLSSPVTSIEEAVFYLGIRQVRQLAMSTPVIEDLQKISRHNPFPWRGFWQHCIATAIMTREISSAIQPAQDELEYVAGLLHDVGRIVMAAEFPTEFGAVCTQAANSTSDLRDIEIELLGMDHCELGAMYLAHHRLPDSIVDTARWHADPTQATRHAPLVAAVQLANHIVRLHRIGDSGNPAPINEEAWLQLPGWGILFPDRTEEDQEMLRNDLKHSLARLPQILDGII